MTQANRVRLSGVDETTFGTLPASPAMLIGRMNSEGFAYRPEFTRSEEIRSDRMLADLIKVGEANAGPIAFELSFMPWRSLASQLWESAFFSRWISQPYRDNFAGADGVISDVDGTGQDVTVTNSAPQDGAFVTGQLVRFTGFTNAANNAKRKCTTGSATNPVFASSGLVNEPAPPVTARMKVVGFEGATGDLATVADGITSSALDFTTLGLTLGQELKIGDADNAVYNFATAACNARGPRVIAIAANKITLDNLPTGWGVDDGSGKTIRIFYGDVLKPGLTRISTSIERAFLGQATPTYVLQKGAIANQLSLSYAGKTPVSGSFEMMALTGAQGTVANGAAYVAAPTNRVMAPKAHVGRLAENGATHAGPNWCRSFTFQLNNGAVPLDDIVGVLGAADIVEGEAAISGGFDCYFGDNSILTRLFNATPTNFSIATTLDNQGLTLHIPRAILSDGPPTTPGKNQQVATPFAWEALLDPLVGTNCLFNRFEYLN